MVLLLIAGVVAFVVGSIVIGLRLEAVQTKMIEELNKDSSSPRRRVFTTSDWEASGRIAEHRQRYPNSPLHEQRQDLFIAGFLLFGLAIWCMIGLAIHFEQW